MAATDLGPSVVSRCCLSVPWSGCPADHRSPSEAANQTVKSKEASGWRLPMGKCILVQYRSQPLEFPDNQFTFVASHLCLVLIEEWLIVDWTNQVPS